MLRNNFNKMIVGILKMFGGLLIGTLIIFVN